jgi:putative endonuclease
LKRSRERGKEGEEIASRLLRRKGYSIIARNYRSSFGEVDIIAFEPESRTLVFVEVRLRSSTLPCHPLETITPKKIERIKKTALHFLQRTTLNYSSVRFDVVAIVNGQATHLINAF